MAVRGWLSRLVLAPLGGTLMLGGLWSGAVRAESRNAVVISLDTPIGPRRAGYVMRSLHL
jgi:hypothetical protein